MRSKIIFCNTLNPLVKLNCLGFAKGSS